MPLSTKQNQEKFLAAFENSISAKQASRESGINYQTMMNWKTKDQDGFRARYVASNERRLDNLEENMFDVIGWATQEENYARVLRYPTLLMFALKAGRPQYRDSVQVATGAADLISAITKLNDGDKQEDTSNVTPTHEIPITKSQVQKLEGSISDQLKDIFTHEE